MWPLNYTNIYNLTLIISFFKDENAELNFYTARNNKIHVTEAYKVNSAIGNKFSNKPPVQLSFKNQKSVNNHQKSGNKENDVDTLILNKQISATRNENNQILQSSGKHTNFENCYFDNSIFENCTFNYAKFNNCSFNGYTFN